MKIKIFEGYPANLEIQISNWLKENEDVQIAFSPRTTYTLSGFIVVTIFYK